MKIDMNNFLKGVGEILNIFPTINTPKLRKPLKINSTFDEDAKNLAQDWHNIGNDIRKAMSENAA